MDLINGKYLNKDILAFFGNKSNMWLIIFDGKYNYMLFNCCNSVISHAKERNRLPWNNIGSGRKYVEFYSNFDNALDNLMRVVSNGNSFKPTFLREVFE